jgi:hypothetical protein
MYSHTYLISVFLTQPPMERMSYLVKKRLTMTHSYRENFGIKMVYD